MANLNNSTALTKEHECTVSEAAILLELLTEAGDRVMMWGPPGVGKSDIVHQLGAKKKRKVIEFHAVLRETVDLRGVPSPNHETKTTDWFPPDELPNAERDGEEGYLFIDEIVQASPQMQAALGGLILYGVVGEYHLPKGWKIIAAGNRVSDRAAAQKMPTHVRNRFAHIYVKTDIHAYSDWANKNGVAPELVAYLRLRSENLHVMPKGDENAFPTPRSWTKCSKYVNAPRAHRLRLFAAHVGDVYAADLDGFIDLYHSMGSLDAIIADPANAKLPTESSIRFAVCTGLARLATRQNIPAIVQYAERLPRESQILVIHDATTRDETLKKTPAYGKWAVKNQDLTIQ